MIGAGLPRTGTASFSQALAILLDGPVYHGGTQTTIGPETNVLSWIDILNRAPVRSEADRKYIDETLRKVTAGYVGLTDTPNHCFVEELMDIYPDAKVICTVRNPDSWAVSIDKLSNTVTKGTNRFLRFALFLVPGLRYFHDYIDLLNAGRWGELYGPPDEGKVYIHGRAVWDRHMEYLHRVVPKAKLIFFDVRGGWEPLCKALDVPVPQDIEFPRINDAEATETFAKAQVRKGLLRWAVALGAAAVMAVGTIPAVRLFE